MIAYEKYDHPAIFTCEEAEKLMPDLPGAGRKNLFLKDKNNRMFLGVEPGSATILGLITDTDHNVELIVDRDIWEADAIQCHPLVNTATLVIPHEGIEQFLQATGHEARVMEIPSP